MDNHTTNAQVILQGCLVLNTLFLWQYTRVFGHLQAISTKAKEVRDDTEDKEPSGGQGDDDEEEGNGASETPQKRNASRSSKRSKSLVPVADEEKEAMAGTAT